MENQYCRVGTITPMGNERLALTLLEYQYQNFKKKATDFNNADKRLAEFFENKAMQIKKIMENLVQ